MSNTNINSPTLNISSTIALTTAHSQLFQKIDINNTTPYNPDQLVEWVKKHKSITVDLNYLGAHFKGNAQECWNWMVREYEKSLFERKVEEGEKSEHLYDKKIVNNRLELLPLPTLKLVLPELNESSIGRHVEDKHGGSYDKFFEALTQMYDQQIALEQVDKGIFTKKILYTNVALLTLMTSVLHLFIKNVYDIKTYSDKTPLTQVIAGVPQILVMAVATLAMLFAVHFAIGVTIAFIISTFDSLFFKLEPKPEAKVA